MTATSTFPTTPEELAKHPLSFSTWYYSVELLPGVEFQGAYPPSLPMLPRHMMRHVDPAGMECLDIGTMEGLVPVLLARRGAKRVLAVDASEHVVDRLAAVCHYHDVDVEFQSVGLLYDLHRKLAGQRFDFINLSGVLYHVFSPLMVLAAVRPLLKPGGIIEVSTNITYQDSFSAEWNDAGRLQREANTFWYPSIPTLDYMLRMLKLAPIDCLHVEHEQTELTHVQVDGLRTGYVSILCRAEESVVATSDDEWMRDVERMSWEHQGLTDWKTASMGLGSEIRHVRGDNELVDRTNTQVPCIDVWASVQRQPSLPAAEHPRDSHLLRLEDQD